MPQKRTERPAEAKMTWILHLATDQVLFPHGSSLIRKEWLIPAVKIIKKLSALHFTSRLKTLFQSKLVHFCLINYTVQHKKNSKTKGVDFGKFWRAEHEYDIYFFLSRQVFSAFYMLIQKDRPEFSLLDLGAIIGTTAESCSIYTKKNSDSGHP